MRIQLSCSSCFHDFSVSDELLGRRVKCPSCSEPVRVKEQDDDDEPERRPRRSSNSGKSSKRKPVKSAGNHGLMIGLGIGGGILILGLVVTVVVLLMRPSRPTTEVASNPLPTTTSPASAPAVIAPSVSPAAPAPVAQTPTTAAPAIADAAPPTKVEIAEAKPPAPSPDNSTESAPSSTPAVSSGFIPETPAKSETEIAKVGISKLQGVPEPSQQKLDLPELIQRVEPSVVRINVLSKQGSSTGSGFVVSNNGIVVTNYHVVTDAIEAKVEFKNKSTAKVLGYLHLVPQADIAIIKIDMPKDQLKPVPISSTLPTDGEYVATFGAPHGLSFSKSEGVISAIRSKTDLAEEMGLDMVGTWLQFTAPISPGNSGGPLVDKYGKVVGMNTMQSSTGQNLNFAISCLEIADALSQAPDKVKPLKPEDLKHYERQIGRKVASDEYDTPRGRRLFAEVKEIVLLSGASIRNFDPQGEIWNRVITRSERAVEKTGIQLSFGNPRPDVAILVVVLQMTPSKKGTGGTQELSVSAELTCVDPLAKQNESPLAKVWKAEQKIGTISLSSAARGVVPQTVDTKLADFFGSFRTAYNRAVKANKEAKP